MKKYRSKTAFSMIELAVVALIISVLAGTIITASRISTNARLATAQSLTASSPVDDIDSLVLWYETTMPKSFNDLSADDGKTVSAWYDLSPNKNNATAVVAPTYTANVINGLPVLRFSGTQYLNFDGTSIANSNYTVIVVEQRSSNKNTNYFVSGNGASSNNEKPHFGYRTDTLITFAQYGNDFDATVPSYTSPIPRIHVFRFNSAVGKDLYINGTLFISQTTTAAKTGLVSYSNAQIAAYSGSPCYAGDIAEIIIFNKYINENERKDIQQYLGKKWGITTS